MNFAENVLLVLRSPQHYHVRVITYKEVTPEGNFQWSTEYNLVANDQELAVSRAKELSGKANSHIASVVQCSDKEHLKGL
jgi:hypothetical protein